MYTEHFQLNDYPFRITPDTDYLYLSNVHARAKAYMEYAVFNREGFVVITGEIGSGKTTLIKKLMSEIDDDNIVVAEIFQTQLDEVELLQAILVEFGLNPFGAKKVELLGMANQFLVDSYLEGKHVLLIVDDAQNLSKRALDELTMLSAVETQKEKILHVILVGQPELNQKIEAPDMEQLLQRVSLRYHVRSLNEKETKEYINHRLKIAGAKKVLFNDKLVPQIFEYTGGVPRLINTFCDTVLTCSFADNNKVVKAVDVKNAIAELQWKKHDEVHKSKLEFNSFFEGDSLLAKNNDNNGMGNDELNQFSPSMFGSISSRSLVEIYKQLKRIADALEQKNNN